MTRMEKLRSMATDGPVTAPVWFQHALKVLTSSGIAWLAFAIGNLWWSITPSGAALVGGFGFYIVLRTIYIITPIHGDLTVYGIEDKVSDFLVDFALAMTCVIFGLIAERNVAAAGAVFVGCLAAWWVPLLHSRP